MSVNWRSAEKVHNPLFRQGYNEVWQGFEPAISTLWEDEDLTAYQHGRRFGTYVQAQGTGHVPLLKHNYIYPRCLELMVCAMREGALG